MTDLTEQWKKGELPEGWYYIKCDDGICFDRFTYYGGFSKIFNYSVKQILAEVPSYDEWQALKASYEMSNDANLKQATWMADMEKENAHLAEQIIKAKQAMSQALSYLACMDRISDTEPNEQLAFDVLRKCLKELEKY